MTLTFRVLRHNYESLVLCSDQYAASRCTYKNAFSYLRGETKRLNTQSFLLDYLRHSFARQLVM